MNTDNTSISGETIDYGPCAFMDAYDPAMVFSSIDEQGRYAYANQPRIALWNLTRLAECLLPLFSDDKDNAVEQARDWLLSHKDYIQTVVKKSSRWLPKFVDGLLAERISEPCIPRASALAKKNEIANMCAGL